MPLFSGPGESKLVRCVLKTGLRIYDVGCDSDVLRDAIQDNDETLIVALTTIMGNWADEVECRMYDVKRRMDPMGTGWAKDMPSSDKNLMGPRVNMLQLAKPSYMSRQRMKSDAVPCGLTSYANLMSIRYH